MVMVKKETALLIRHRHRAHQGLLAEDIDHVLMVMVTGDKESGMSSSGQGSDQLEMSPGHKMSPDSGDQRPCAQPRRGEQHN